MDKVVACCADYRVGTIRTQSEGIKVRNAHFIAIGKAQYLDLIEIGKPILQGDAIACKYLIGPKLDD